MTTNLVVVLAIALIFSNPVTSFANDVRISQIGDDVDMDIVQDGENNKIGSLNNLGGQAFIMTYDPSTLSYTQRGNNNELGLYNSDIGASIVTSVQTGDDNVAFIDCHGYDCTMTLTQTGSDNTAHLESGGSYSHINNDITGTQTGDNNDLHAEVLTGSNNTIIAEQYCTQGSSCVTNDMDVLVTGSTNSVAVVQGRVYLNSSGTLHTDSNEPGGLTMDIDITGSNNGLMMSQRNQNTNHAHNIDVDVTGDYNSVFGTQVGSGSKDIDIDISGDANSISAVQTGNGSHTATMNLSSPNGPAYTINLTQQGNTGQSYTMSGICTNPNGCAYTVNQQ